MSHHMIRRSFLSCSNILLSLSGSFHLDIVGVLGVIALTYTVRTVVVYISPICMLAGMEVHKSHLKIQTHLLLLINISNHILPIQYKGSGVLSVFVCLKGCIWQPGKIRPCKISLLRTMFDLACHSLSCMAFPCMIKVVEICQFAST